MNGQVQEYTFRFIVKSCKSYFPFVVNLSNHERMCIFLFRAGDNPQIT
jgi:hypothetical protein